jgi:hypothetical protein
VSHWTRHSLRLALKQGRARARLRKRDRDFVRRAQLFEQRFAQLPLGPAPDDGRRRSFSHAGNAGDIVFSLPALRAISGDAPARYLLQINAPAFYAEGLHPLGRLRMNEALARMLMPLLEAQPYIDSAAIHDGTEAVDYRLDLFREAPLPGDKGYLARWYFYTYGVNWDLSRPWLSAPAASGLSEALLIARSQRYRNPLLDYRFLARYPRLLFIGVPVEFEEMRAQLPRLEHYPVQDCLQMASAIASCRLFIGNQSLPFAIAEALKVRRVLEACPRAPTNVPEGPDAHDCYFQRQFEFVVARQFDRPP